MYKKMCCCLFLCLFHLCDMNRKSLVCQIHNDCHLFLWSVFHTYCTSHILNTISYAYMYIYIYIYIYVYRIVLLYIHIIESYYINLYDICMIVLLSDQFHSRLSVDRNILFSYTFDPCLRRLTVDRGYLFEWEKDSSTLTPHRHYIAILRQKQLRLDIYGSAAWPSRSTTWSNSI